MTTSQTIDGVPLLPCPFCGGEPYGTHDHYVHDDLSTMPCVECRSCSAHLKAEDWNRRVQPAPVAVVMPERLDLPHRDEFESADQYAGAIGEAKKWNACLDELKHLNHSL